MSPRNGIYTPAMLADRWQCSERHIRNMIARGELRSFRVGGKLLRIPEEAAREHECQGIASGVTEGSIASSIGREGNGTVTLLEPLTRVKLNAVRRLSIVS